MPRDGEFLINANSLQEKILFSFSFQKIQPIQIMFKEKMTQHGLGALLTKIWAILFQTMLFGPLTLLLKSMKEFLNQSSLI